MLITLLKHEYLPVLDTLAADPEFSDFVSILGEMIAQRHHALRAPPLLLDAFSRWPRISAQQAQAFRDMARAVTLCELPFDEVTDSLVVTGPAGASPIPEARTRWHRRHWTWLLQKTALPRTCLAGENLADAAWYSWLGRAYAQRQRTSSLNAGSEIQLRYRGVGGSTAIGEVRQEIEQGHVVLCILDSDQDHPEGELGGTARAVQTYVSQLASSAPSDALLHLEILKARDVENLLPREVVEEVASKGDPWFLPMTGRGFFPGNHVEKELCYLDLGKDQCERRLLDTKDSRTLAYRRLALARLKQIDPSCPGVSGCPKATGSTECGAGTGDSRWKDMERSCLVLHSVGKKLLPAIVEYLRKEDASAGRGGASWLADRIPQDPAILGPAELAWSWGLSLPRRV